MKLRLSTQHQRSLSSFLLRNNKSISTTTTTTTTATATARTTRCMYSVLARNATIKPAKSGVVTTTTTPPPATQSVLFKDSSMIAANHRKQFFSTDKESAMEDEYGEMTSDGKTYTHDVPFVLENGQVLPKAELRYQTYGELNAAKDNVLVVCHALTGNASLHSWWGEMLGPGLAFDTSKYFVVCSNILGSCYGSTSPMSVKENDNSNNGGDIYGVDFPDISVRDTVHLQLCMLKNDLQVNSIKCVIGGSFGGMQVVEFAVQGGTTQEGDSEPFVRSVIPIACGAAHTAWQIAISEVQRQAIYADPEWVAGNYGGATQGLSVARQIGMVSYRTPVGYVQKFGRKVADGTPAYGSKAFWSVKSYLEYQGQKFLSRFDPITYVKMTEQMDTHDVGRGRGGIPQALSKVEIPALVLGIDSDVLYPLYEQEELAAMLPNSQLKIINSDAGHDGFLLEQDQVGSHITEFLATHD